MTQAFYKEKLISAGIDVVIPDDEDIELVNRVIYHELCLGIISEQSKREYSSHHGTAGTERRTGSYSWLY